VNLVLLIDMGSVLPFTQHLDVTRRIVLRVLSKLRLGDRVILIQFTNRAEVLQDWTDDSAKVVKALDPERGKLLSGNRSRLTEGILATARKLTGKEVGSTHLVLITDGDDSPGSGYVAAVNQLLQFQPSMHLLSYTTLAAQEVKKRKGPFTFDRAMKRFYKDYAVATEASERRLTAFAENLGGRIFLPTSEEHALKIGDEIASNMGARYVLTYIPKRVLDSADSSKPRYIEVFSRRTGLQVQALRTRVAKTAVAAP
jgi:von Willebrand factor type A domain